LPLKHITKEDLRKKENSELLRRFDRKIIEFIKRTYKKVDENVRVLENFGDLASVKNHTHKQIWYTKSKGLHFVNTPINYN
jgi:galactose-1-phosphate uridylyltransferase